MRVLPRNTPRRYLKFPPANHHRPVLVHVQCAAILLWRRMVVLLFGRRCVLADSAAATDIVCSTGAVSYRLLLQGWAGGEAATFGRLYVRGASYFFLSRNAKLNGFWVHMLDFETSFSQFHEFLRSYFEFQFAAQLTHFEQFGSILIVCYIRFYSDSIFYAELECLF